MGEIERLLPGTKVSDWASTAIVANPGYLYVETGAGYLGGGGFTYIATVNRFSFPGDARTVLGTGLSVARAALAGTANAGVAGYYGGGVDQSTGSWNNFDTVDKFAFSNDSRSVLGTGLSSVRQSHAGMADSGVGGYFGGDGRHDRFSFADDSRSSATSLSDSRIYLAGWAHCEALS